MTTDTRIESLETQVRTLKRVVYGACGLVVVGGVAKWKQMLPAKVLILTALLPVLVVGCAPSFNSGLYASFAVHCWEGANFSEVLSIWGAPDSVFTSSEGEKYYKWNESGRYRCVVEMVVDGDGVVKKASWDGQNGGRRYLYDKWRPGTKPSKEDFMKGVAEARLRLEAEAKSDKNPDLDKTNN